LSVRHWSTLAPAIGVTAGWLLLLTVALRPHVGAVLGARGARVEHEMREQLRWIVMAPTARPATTTATRPGARARERVAPPRTEPGRDAPALPTLVAPDTPADPASTTAPIAAADTGSFGEGPAAAAAAATGSRRLAAPMPVAVRRLTGARSSLERLDSVMGISRPPPGMLLRPVGPPDHDAGRALAGRELGALTIADRSAMARALMAEDAARANPPPGAWSPRADIARAAAIADVMRGWRSPGEGRPPSASDTTPRRGWRRWLPPLQGLPGGGPTRGERARERAIHEGILQAKARTATRRRAIADSVTRAADTIGAPGRSAAMPR
jgi:hypothetical protein